MRLAALEEIADPGTRSVVMGEGLNRLDLLVVRKGGTVRAYVNSCPHQGTPLEIFGDRILNEDASLLVCSTHGARFRVEDGFCVGGPCKGDRLQPVAVRIEAGAVLLDQNIDAAVP